MLLKFFLVGIETQILRYLSLRWYK